jgi:hypothetical protein
MQAPKAIRMEKGRIAVLLKKPVTATHRSYISPSLLSLCEDMYPPPVSFIILYHEYVDFMKRVLIIIDLLLQISYNK